MTIGIWDNIDDFICPDCGSGWGVDENRKCLTPDCPANPCYGKDCNEDTQPMIVTFEGCDYACCALCGWDVNENHFCLNPDCGENPCLGKGCQQ